MKSVLSFILLLLVSCINAKQVSPDGTTTEVKAFGGRGVAKGGPDGLKVAWNNEKSFYHGAVVAGALITTAGTAITTGLAEQTTQHVATEVTKRQANKAAAASRDLATRAGVTNTANTLNTSLEIPAVNTIAR